MTTEKKLASTEQMRDAIRKMAHPKGRPVDAEALEEVRAVLGCQPSEGHPKDLLIEHLHRLNDQFMGLRARHINALAHDMRLSQAEVYEVASFYHHFVLLDDSDNNRLPVLRVCNGLSCQLQGGQALFELAQAVLGEKARVQQAPCIGRCEQAPAAWLSNAGIGHASIDKLSLALDGVVEQTKPYIDFDLYRSEGGYALLEELASGKRNLESIMVALENSGLRGLGGAGFAAGKKWRIVRSQPAPRVLVVNIDEGEPGTFKDRTYLEQDPHRFLEGALIAAHAIEARAIYIYIRDEYPECRRLLKDEIDRLRANPPCPLPSMVVRRGAGAYICGEESAMIESIEGRRGEPRLRPPYIAERGLFGLPTLAHNFETLFWVRAIIENGASWLTKHGRHGRKGLRSFSVSGRVKNPGVKLAPAGITLQELIDEFCGGMQEGHKLYAYMPGGASGGILPASLAHIPLDFDTLQPYGCFIGSAAVIVLSEQDSVRESAQQMMQFFAHESCGQCTPCRVGTDKAAELMKRPVWDEATLNDLATAMADASICGLGQAAPNPMRSVLKYFTHEIR